MKLLLAFLAVLSLGALPANASDHVKVTVKTDPEVACPDGWVDVVFHYELDPGWHAVSPRSANGLSVSATTKLPDGLRTVGGLWAAPGQIVKDPTLGEVEQFAGKGQLRQRLHVASDMKSGKYKLSGSTIWQVCDASKCLPPQTIDFDFELPVSDHAGRGPLMRNIEAMTALTPAEQSLLNSNGFVVRAHIDGDRARGGDDRFVVLDFVIARGLIEDSIQIQCLTQEGRYISLEGWRAYVGTLSPSPDSPPEKAMKTFREIVPLRFYTEGTVGKVAIPVSVTIGSHHADKPATALATQEMELSLDYKP